MIGCNTQKENGIIETINQELNVQFEDETDEGDLQKFYTLKLPAPTGTKTIKIKGIIDRKMNMLPTEKEERKMSSFWKCLYDHYKWETPQREVTLEIRWESKDYAYIRIWILNK